VQVPKFMQGTAKQKSIELHVAPTKPFAQVHVKPEAPLTQDPPFKHGLVKQKF